MRRTDAPKARVAARVDEIDGRDLLIGERWVIDFGSRCHLGLDLDEELIDAIGEYLARWGAHAPWSTVSALHEDLEAAIGRLLGSPRPLLAASIDRIHLTAVQALAAGGTMFVDERARPLRDAALVAHGAGADVLRFGSGDPDRLHALLAGSWRRPGMVCVGAVDALTGEPAPIRELLALTRDHGAVLYVDESVSFGVLGERSPFEPSPYGIRGNGAVAHFSAGGDGVVVAASLERTCASPIAFLVCGEPQREVLRRACEPAAGDPGAVGALAAAIEGLRLNERRGDKLRARLHRLTERLAGPGRFPVLALAQSVTDPLIERGIHAPPGEHGGGPLIHVTAAHSDEQIATLERVLTELAAPFKLHRASAE